MQSLNVKSLADENYIISVNFLPGLEGDTTFFFFLFFFFRIKKIFGVSLPLVSFINEYPASTGSKSEKKKKRKRKTGEIRSLDQQHMSVSR